MPSSAELSSVSCYDDVPFFAKNADHELETRQLMKSESCQHKSLKEVLKYLDVLPAQSLSSSGRQNLSQLVELASLLRLYDVNYDSFCESVKRELCKREQLDREVSMRKKQVDIINKKLNTIHKKFELLKSHVQETKNSECSEKTEKQTQFQYLATKCSKYSTQIAHLRRRLDMNTKNCTHNSLSERAEHLANIRSQISEVRRELDTYIEFPADINLAKVKLEEAKRQLELLDQNLSVK